MGALRKRGKYWYVDYTDAAGRRVVRSTGEIYKERAQQILHDLEHQAHRGRLGLSPGHRPPKKIGFYEFTDIYLQHCKTHNVNLVDKRIKMRAWERVLGDIPLSSITADRVEEYKRNRIPEVKPSSINRYVGCLRAALNLAVEWGYLAANPIARIKQLREPQGRLRFLSREEVGRLLEQCDGHLRRIVMVAVYTGMRRGEILKLVSDDIDLRGETIAVRDTKNRGLTRYLPIHEELKPVFREAVRTAGDDGRLFSAENIDRKFRSAMQRASIDGASFHTLRHTFASHMVMSGCDPMTLAKLMGHSSVVTTMRYAHLAPDYAKGAVSRLVF